MPLGAGISLLPTSHFQPEILFSPCSYSLKIHMDATLEAIYCLLALFPNQCPSYLPAGFDSPQLLCQVFGWNTCFDGLAFIKAFFVNSSNCSFKEVESVFSETKNQTPYSVRADLCF